MKQNILTNLMNFKADNIIFLTIRNERSKQFQVTYSKSMVKRDNTHLFTYWLPIFLYIIIIIRGRLTENMERQTQKCYNEKGNHIDTTKLLQNAYQCRCNFRVRKQIANIQGPTSQKFDQYIFQIRKNFILQFSSDQSSLIDVKRLDYSVKIKYYQLNLMSNNQMISENQKKLCSFLLSFTSVHHDTTQMADLQPVLQQFQFQSHDNQAHDFLNIILNKPVMIQIEDLRTIFKPGKKVYDTKTLKIFEATNIKSGLKFAVKSYPKQKFNNAYQYNLLRAQMLLLYSFRHQNIVNIHNTYCTNNSLYIIQQVFQTNLEKVILYDKQVQWSVAVVKDVMLQLLKGLHYLHSNNIIHRQLIPKNILIKNHRKLPIRVAISGFSRSQVNGIGINQFGNPEEDVSRFLENMEMAIEDKQGKSSDIYQLGQIFQHMYIIFYNRVNKLKEFDPRNKIKQLEKLRNDKEQYEDREEQHEKGKQQQEQHQNQQIKKKRKLAEQNILQFQQSINQAEQLIQNMTAEDNKLRISATQALNHTFFRPAHNN